MKYKVVFLHQAEADLRALKHYIVKNFSQQTWQTSYAGIKNAVNSLKLFPQTGSVLPELEHLHMIQYRQVISGMTRIIYELRQDIVYIHLVCDIRREMKSVLMQRILSQ